ncbi:uncharacterized protein LOC111024751 [Momordica charantia]|uniref:Uncharacterized protein LOC111024751 n=1 Tax=Momordica charantia TaxID=3673 RepID=A0A6J1DV78_MOMCH|nr:uncharacterized protein LOC111024751 [Momordica charantia]
MLVKSKQTSSNLGDLTEAFNVLRKYQMKLNPSKCAFKVSSRKFLGFMVHERGIEVNPDKIKAVLEMEAPKNIKQLQRLNGRLAALNRFVSRSTNKCHPFFQVLRKKGRFEWTDDCEAALRQLKQYLSSAPLLSKPLPGDVLYLYLAVSENAVSSVLVREAEGRQSPVYYTSKSLTEAEARYPYVEKLALALVTSARRLRPYFQAHKIIVPTNFPLRQIFYKPETSGRLMKWALELSEHDIAFEPRTALKGQAAAEFVAELTPPRPGGDVHDQWTLYVDGSSNEKGCGADMLLLGPGSLRFEYALRFSFRASNNEAEYEALINGLKVARGMGVRRLLILSDSQLCQSGYRGLPSKGSSYGEVPRSENSNADALALLASAYETDLPRTVPVEILVESSIDQPEIMDITSARPTWMDPIKDFLVNGSIPADPSQARKLRRQAAHYLMQEGKLFKRGYSLPLLRCLDPEEARYVMREIHEGVCGNHGGARSMAAKVVRQGYYWPTIERDTKEFAKTCDKCQRFASILRQPPEMLTPISSPWPFAQWGIDLIDPLPMGKGQLKFAIVAVDYFTKWVEAEPLASITEVKVVSFVWKSIICRFGIPNAIITDNGKQFDGARFNQFCQQLGIRHLSLSPSHP